MTTANTTEPHRDSDTVHGLVGHRPDYLLRVAVSNDAVMFVPHPATETSVEWLMRYGREFCNGVPRSAELAAAALLDSYAYLLCANIPMREATRRLGLMRKAVANRLISNTQDQPESDSGRTIG